jgi:hypothetical protein
MRNLLLALLHLAVVTAKLCGSGGVRAVMAENLLLKQQLIVLRRARQRAPNLTPSDRLLCRRSPGRKRCPGEIFADPNLRLHPYAATGRRRWIAVGQQPSPCP